MDDAVLCRVTFEVNSGGYECHLLLLLLLYCSSSHRLRPSFDQDPCGEDIRRSRSGKVGHVSTVTMDDGDCERIAESET